jgi:chaperonin GroEL
MVAKEILYDNQARARIGAGLNRLADTVKLTLGPRGANIALDVGRGAPVISKDGVSVAQEISFANRFANMGADIIKEAATATAVGAGDGTTTSTVLAQAIYEEGARLVAAGVDPMALKRGIDTAVGVVIQELLAASKPTQSNEEIENVATISANGDRTLGAIIGKAMAQVGPHGVVLVENGTSTETTLTVTEGLKVDRGYLSPYFLTDTSSTLISLTDAYVFVHEGRLTTIESLLPLVEKVAASGRPLLVIADVDGDALAMLVVNKLRGTLDVCAIKPPGFGDERTELLEDIAIAVGTQTLSPALGRSAASLTLDELGSAERITIGREHTVIVDGKGSKRARRSRMQNLEDELHAQPTERRAQALRTRLGKLGGGIAIIKVGAFTESEMAEKRQRVDDAVSATQAAVEEGILPGGGVALLRTIAKVEALSLAGEERFALGVMIRALQRPLFQIAVNGGSEGSVVVDRVRQGTGAFGYNALTQKFEDLVVSGIIDPTKSVRLALQNAASVATMMLTVAVGIAQSERPPLKSNFATRPVRAPARVEA